MAIGEFAIAIDDSLGRDADFTKSGSGILIGTRLAEALGVHVGETSADGLFTLKEVECLGACVNAPMVMIWKDTYEDLTPESLNTVLDGFASGNPPKPGPQINRQYAAPVTGLTSLNSSAKNDNTDGSASSKPALTDAEPKKQTEAANVRERPDPKPPMGDATATKPPKGAS